MTKIIGLLGGLSPESTVDYYRYITRTYTQKYGDHGYPEIVMFSVSFQSYIDWMNEGNWEEIATGLGTAAKQLENAGADFIVIATNTMHIVIDEVRKAVSVPVLSLLDVVGKEIQEKGLDTVGLLGTRFTMEKDFYHQALEQFGVQVLTPDSFSREIVNDIIFSELVSGEITDQSRGKFMDIIAAMADSGAEGVILGCTEIPLLVHADDVNLPLFDTTALHAEAALKFALEM